MSKPSPPPAPDYTSAAKEQGQASLDAAKLTAQLNRPNEITPYGTQTWTQSGDPNSPQFTSTITLSPEQQQLLDAQNRISMSLAGTGEAGLNRVAGAMNTPFDTSSVPALSGAPDLSTLPALPGSGDFSADRDKVTASIMDRYNTDFNRQMESAKQSLANQGITPGSDAWNRQMDALNRAHNDEQNQAILAGGQEQSRLFGLSSQARQQGLQEQLAGGAFGNQARQQAIQEQSYLRSLPLNELNALRTGSQVTNPSFSQYNNAGTVQAAPMFQAAQAQNQAAQDIYGQQIGSYNNMMSGLFGLGSAAIPFKP
jgi:hypothetical protein